MRALLLILAVLLALLGGQTGCQSPGGGTYGPPPLPPDAVGPPGPARISPEELPHAVNLYNLKCARCHKFYHPADYGPAEWRSWMGKMSRKAHLSSEQEALLSRYMDAFRTASRTAEPTGN